MRTPRTERRGPPQRIAVDLDGTVADLGPVLQREAERLFGPGVTLRDGDAAEASGRRIRQAELHQLWSHLCCIQDFWTTIEEIEPGTVARLVAMASRHRWEVIFLTQRPATKGETAQIQTQPWWQRHGFELPSVYVLNGYRGKLAAALALDVVLDDDAENCIEVRPSRMHVLSWSGAIRGVCPSAPPSRHADRFLNDRSAGSARTDDAPAGESARARRKSARRTGRIVRHAVIFGAAACFSLAFFPTPAPAQVGVQVGANASYLTAPKGTPRKLETDGLIGIFIEAPLVSTIQLHAEIQYVRRRSRITFGTGESPMPTDIEIAYLSTPILVRMPLFGRLYLTEGASLHFPVRAVMTRTGEAGRDVLDNITTPDVSMVVGVGVQFRKVGLEARWDSGFRALEETLGPGEFPTRNRAISAIISLGLTPRP